MTALFCFQYWLYQKHYQLIFDSHQEVGDGVRAGEDTDFVWEVGQWALPKQLQEIVTIFIIYLFFFIALQTAAISALILLLLMRW